MQPHFLGHYLGLSLHMEILILALIGITFTIFDTSLFSLKSNLETVWALTMDPNRFSEASQEVMKYILTNLILVRTLTVHVYLGCYVVLLWPTIIGDHPKLLLPWLIVSALRSIVVTAVAYSCGMYICMAYWFMKPVCLDFALAEIVEYGPSVYMWFCVLSFYKTLKLEIPSYQDQYKKINPNDTETMLRRRRTRSISLNSATFDSKLLLKLQEDNRTLISASTIENVVNHISITSKASHSRSLDSMLQSLAAEAEKQEIMTINDDLKEEIEDETLTISERITKILELTPSIIARAQHVRNKRKSNVASDIVSIVKTDRVKGEKPKFYSDTSSLNKDHNSSNKNVALDALSITTSETELRTISIDADSNEAFNASRMRKSSFTQPTELKSGSAVEKRDSKPTGIPKLIKRSNTTVYGNPRKLQSITQNSSIHSKSPASKTLNNSPQKNQIHKASSSIAKPKVAMVSNTAIVRPQATPKIILQSPKQSPNVFNPKSPKYPQFDNSKNLSEQEKETKVPDDEGSHVPKPRSHLTETAPSSVQASKAQAMSNVVRPVPGTWPEISPIGPSSDENFSAPSQLSTIPRPESANIGSSNFIFGASREPLFTPPIFRAKTSSFREDGFTVAYLARQSQEEG